MGSDEAGSSCDNDFHGVKITNMAHSNKGINDALVAELKCDLGAAQGLRRANLSGEREFKGDRQDGIMDPITPHHCKILIRFLYIPVTYS